MIRIIFAAAVLLTTIATASAQTATPAPTAAPKPETRQLDAHEHGKSALNIAIEGNTVSMDFDAPGDDILGFETEAKTPEQKAALDAAIKTLSSPADLFVLPAAAGCKTATAKVEVNMSAAGHSEFEGKYTLTCADPAKITDIDFKLFKAFPKADKVTVTVISAKGQQQFDATPKKPKVDLAGVM